MNNTMTIQTRMLVAVGMIISLAIVMIGSLVYGVNIMNDSVQRVAQSTVPRIDNLSDIRTDARLTVVALLRSGLAVDPAEIQRQYAISESPLLQLKEDIKKYESVPLLDDEDRRLFGEIKRLAVDFDLAVGRAKTFQTNGDDPSYDRTVEKEVADAAEALCTAATASIDYNIKRSQIDGVAAKATVFKVNLGATIGLVLMILMSAGLLVWLIRTTSRALGSVSTSLGNGARDTASAASQVASSSQELSQGAADQASAIEETSASLEEISAMIRSTADNARKAKSLAGEARSAAENGAGSMEEMRNAMAAINVSSAEVAKIVKNIDEIAFQTNILALNAAVEAARAGDAGAGFAVVADEVRSLAQRSAAAAKETADKIETAIANSRRGSECTAMVGASLSEIRNSVTAADQLVGEIAVAASEQAMGISQVTVAINQIDSISQTNSSTAQQSAAAAGQLDSQAAIMRDLVRRLDGLLGRRSNNHFDSSAASSSLNRPRAVAQAAGGVRRPRAEGLKRPNLVHPNGSNDLIPMPELADDGHDGFRSKSN